MAAYGESGARAPQLRRPKSIRDVMRDLITGSTSEDHTLNDLHEGSPLVLHSRSTHQGSPLRPNSVMNPIKSIRSPPSNALFRKYSFEDSLSAPSNPSEIGSPAVTSIAVSKEREEDENGGSLGNVGGAEMTWEYQSMESEVGMADLESMAQESHWMTAIRAPNPDSPAYLRLWFRFRRACFCNSFLYSLTLQLLAVAVLHLAGGWGFRVREFRELGAAARLPLLIVLYVVQGLQALVLAGALRTMYLCLLYGVGAPRDLFNVSLASMVAFAGVYLLLFIQDPLCFGINDAVLQLDFKTQDSKSIFGMFIFFVYFSCTLFTSIGFGDITPGSWYTRGLVIVQMLFAEIYTIGVFAVGLSHFRFTRSTDEEEDDELDQAAARALRYTQGSQDLTSGEQAGQHISSSSARPGPKLSPFSERRARAASLVGALRSALPRALTDPESTVVCGCVRRGLALVGDALQRVELLLTRYMLTVNIAVQAASLLLLLAIDPDLLLRAEALGSVGSDGTTWQGASLTDHALLVLILSFQALLFVHLMAAAWRLVKRLQSNALGVVFLLKVHVSVLLLFAGLYMAVFLLMGPDSFFLFPLPSPDGTAANTANTANTGTVLAGKPSDLPVLFFQCVYFSVVLGTTTGFGDVFPTSTVSRIIVVSQMLSCFFFNVVLIGLGVCHIVARLEAIWTKTQESLQQLASELVAKSSIDATQAAAGAGDGDGVGDEASQPLPDAPNSRPVSIKRPNGSNGHNYPSRYPSGTYPSSASQPLLHSSLPRLPSSVSASVHHSPSQSQRQLHILNSSASLQSFDVRHHSAAVDQSFAAF